MKKQAQLLFNTIYINGVLASEEDKQAFLRDYHNGKIAIKRVIYNDFDNYGLIETF